MAKMQTLVAPSAFVAGGAGTNYAIKTNSGVHYQVYVDRDNLDVYFRKSADGGKTWSDATVIGSGLTTTQLAVWYDRWSGVSGDLIHCAYSDQLVDDTFYRSIDTANSDTLSSQTVIFAGASTAGGGALSIVRARGGNLYCKVMIDAGAEGGFFRSTDVGANWSSRTDTEALATTDQWILMPGFAANNQDILCIFWDASADEISRYVHDDSGNSWAETSISTGFVDLVATSNYPHFAAAPDLTNSQIVVVAWNGVDTVNADLQAWKVTEGAITALTNVVNNSSDDQGLCAIGIDTDTQDWYVFYVGKSDGTETFANNVNIYYKVSTDDGATWGSETRIAVHTVGTMATNTLYCTPRFDTRSAVVFQLSSAWLIAAIDEPVDTSPTYGLGI